MSFSRIATNIRYYREKCQLTQKQLSEELNVSRPVIAKWENGTVTPDLKSLIELRRVFKVSIDEIVGFETTIPQEPSKGYPLSMNLISKDDWEVIDYLLKNRLLKEQLVRMIGLPLNKQKFIHSMLRSIVNEIKRI
ncbi:helix-turn-helix transcriptional regulator [Aquibacillus salsiterrae]|uniref:Helix-turn-helix domain-containing protein n=1 Tax=Aquibacillus salsiterrae TaxID=2950439 RepID=A0A9X3WE48_9BACI|nr:helix-turn-helix transcriptional regulator [Aquibacillus salsiterrae]MDC3418190.1 helix-turn-helix domain-containing protein [Aquibacillus salsiterrae]